MLHTIDDVVLGLVCVGNEKSDWFLFSCLTLCWSLLPILLFQLKDWNAPVVGDGRICTSKQKMTKNKTAINQIMPSRVNKHHKTKKMFKTEKKNKIK